MNEFTKEFDRLITGITGYLNYQREIYGNEFYSDYDINEIALIPTEIKEQRLLKFQEQIKFCQKCKLAQTRSHLVFGSGNPNANIMLIGEAPGYDEDIQGKPFVGAAGRLLTKILEAIKLTREEVYIANILKCRPPQNRDPLAEEQMLCKPYLERQLEIIEPKFILALGRIAAQVLLDSTNPINELRGKVYDFDNKKLIVTYHPAALLRNSQLKKAAWEDVQLLQGLYQTTN